MTTPDLRLPKFVASIGCIVLLTLLCGCQSKADFDKARWERWTGENAAVSKLDKKVDVLGISIRPPKGFESQPIVDGPEDAKITSWIQRRNDGTVRAVQLMVVPIPKKMGSPTAVQAINNLYGNAQPGSGRRGPNQEPVTMGFVNDIEFARISWKGTSTGFGNGAKEGFFYVAVIDDTIYQLATEDVQNAPAGDLDVCHASILSFEK